MPRAKDSEIDDIFASKVAQKPAVPSADSSTAKGKAKASDEDHPEGVSKKRKRKKKNIAQEQDATNVTTTQGSKRTRPEPETVVDPSAPSGKRLKTAIKDGSTRSGTTKKIKTDEEERFRDSRGTGPRRKTEDGFSIYKEDELGIGNEGGDTPLCPFDCDCCF